MAITGNSVPAATADAAPKPLPLTNAITIAGIAIPDIIKIPASVPRHINVPTSANMIDSANSQN